MEGEKMAYKMMNQDFVKLDKFDGSNFIRWQDKMKFLLTALKIFYVLDPNLQPIPDPTPQDTEQLKQQRIKREEDELVCRGHILNTLSDRLFLKNQMKEKELNTSEANVVDEIVAMVSEMQIGMITEVHMANAAENLSEWWYDSGATIHVCNNKMLFKEYVEAGNGLEVLMGNHNTAKVLGTGTVELILSSGKKLKLTNVYHVPDIKKNLVSASLLSKNGVKAVLESDKLILSKCGVFVGKGYSCNGIGCIAYFRVPDPKRTKLGPRAIKSVFVGYAVNSKAYRLLDLSSNTIVESRDVEFIENKFLNDSQIEPKQTQEFDSLVNDSLSRNKRIEPSSPSEQRRSQRVRKEKDFGPNFISYQVNVYLVEGNREKVLSKLPFVGNMEEDPNTFSEAMASRDAAFWREAINDEMDSILSNNTWVLVDLPPGSNTIGCKWVFRRKYRTDGTIQTFKVRLVAKGFRQREGIDYFDTYAPVARITSIRVLIALASIYKLVVHQMDVKTAFLNGDLDEEVYMDQPEGFVLPGNEKKVCVCETKKYLASVFKMKDLNETDIILDIAFAVNRLSRYTSNPSAEHWKAIARVLGYLKKTKDIGLYYSGYPAVLKGYSDANWVTSVGDNKSTSGWIFTLGKKAEWLRNMLYDIELWPQPMSAISIYCDSQATNVKSIQDIKKELHLCEHRSGAASKQELSRLDVVPESFCLTQSPGQLIQATGSRQLEAVNDR
uniref:Uncharacterized protein n=1 Tax=Fagus sylvatica TaxID=28930 RepID=A0A2N9GWL4_FAGSY